MTDGLDQNQAADTAVPQKSPEMEQMAAIEAAQEKMLRQSEVNELAGRIRSEAYEKGRQQAMSEYQKQQESVSAQQRAQGALSEEEVRRIVQEQAIQFQQQQAQQMMAEKIVGDFIGKMNEGPSKYEDFEDVVKDIELSKNADLVQLANSVPNTADVMYDIAKHPNKLANLKMLLQHSPALAIKEIQHLSNSIVKNEKSKDQYAGIKEPLSKLKPSAGTVDSGNLSVADLRSQDWLRG